MLHRVISPAADRLGCSPQGFHNHLSTGDRYGIPKPLFAIEMRKPIESPSTPTAASLQSNRLLTPLDTLYRFSYNLTCSQRKHSGAPHSNFLFGPTLQCSVPQTRMTGDTAMVDLRTLCAALQRIGLADDLWWAHWTSPSPSPHPLRASKCCGEPSPACQAVWMQRQGSAGASSERINSTPEESKQN